MENGGGGGIESIIPLRERWSVYFNQKTEIISKIKINYAKLKIGL